MSGSQTFKCPSCGAYMEYDPTGGSMTCPYCGTAIRTEDIPASALQEDAAQQAVPASGAVRGYHCSNCGAEVVIGDTTAATRCYYCHSPVVILDRLREDFKPDMVVPFSVSREEVESKFQAYLSKKRFVDHRFFSAEQRESLSGVYYPYWFGEVQAHAETSGDAKRVRTYVTGKYQITETDTYRIQRSGTIRVGNMYRKALSSVSRLLSDGIFPYETEKALAFKPEYLSGFMAEMRDVPQESVQSDLVSEVERHANQIMSHDLNYTSVSTHTSLSNAQTSMKYALLPAWVLTYSGSAGGGKDSKPYYFMMNGQTGTVCGRLPVDKKKLLTCCSIVFGAIAAAMIAGGMLIW